MGKITLQKIFDAAWEEFIVKDKPPAQGLEGACMYRAPNGGKCAIGLVISDELAATYEGKTISKIFRDHPHLFDIKPEDKDKLFDIQWDLHDGLTEREGWKEPFKLLDARREKYKTVAAAYGLIVPE